MDPITWEGDPPELRSPILVCAFAGWNDAASAATAALEAIAASHEAGIAARLDPEEFYDFQVNRPTIRLVEGQAREIDWPANTLLAVEVPTAERDLALLSGVEPNVRWRTFAEAIVDAARLLEIEIVITLGALIADVAHTRPVPITGLASDPDLVERLGLSRSSYEGPTGIVGVLHDACRRHDLVSASLWAAVPHYVAAVPNPKAALALLRRLEGLTGIAVEASELEDATERFEEQVDRAVSANPEIEELELERSNYEGPTGIVGVVHDLCRQNGIDSASLWAAVPHYVAAVPNPKAALALLRRLEGLTGIAVEASELEEETVDYEEQIGRAVAANPEIEDLVSRIEAEQADLLEEGEELPSADTLAREFQRFLRQRGDDKS